MATLTPAEKFDLMRRLSKSRTFELVSRDDLARIVSLAEKQTMERGGTLCARGAPATHLFMLLDGEFRSEGGTRVDLIETGGAIIALESVMKRDATYDATLTARSETATYLSIDAKGAQDIYWRSPPLRHALAPLFREATTATEAQPYHGAAIVEFVSQIPETPLSFLVELLALEIGDQFPDNVLVVRPRPPGGAEPAPKVMGSGGRGKASVAYADGAWVQANQHRYDYVFLDGVSYDATILVELVLAAPSKPLPPPGPCERAHLRTVVVQPAPLPCARSLTVEPANPGDLETSRACRVQLSFSDLRKLSAMWSSDAPMTVLDPDLRTNLGVWARALTHRRTGLAIGGGGVFAMTSVYVLQRLWELGVPIDVITGASGGSLVGAFYAARGLGGLETLVEAGDSGKLDAVVTAAMLCGSILQGYVSCALGGACLEHLPYAEFYPASSNISGGLGVVATRGPVALGVRAASSTPPLFGSTISRRQRLADGAFTNNLPVQALWRFDAGVSLAINSYPPSRLPVCGLVPECLVQAASTLSVLDRTASFVTAFNLLASVSGAIEAGFAKVAYFAESKNPAPYLVISNFRLSSRFVADAAANETLNEKIDEFASLWGRIRDRHGAPPHTSATAPASAPPPAAPSAATTSRPAHHGKRATKRS